MEKTHWKKLTNPNYLGSYAFQPDEEKVGIISKVVQEKVKNQDGKEEECLVCYFTGQLKPLILNKTNSKTIAKIHESPFIEDWKGKAIQMYVAKVKAFGERVDAVRIREFIPKLEKPELKIGTPRFEKALKSIAAGEITIEAIKEKMKLSKEAEDQLKTAITK